MLGYVIRRLWQMIPTMAGVILLVFVLFNWVGGDPAYVLAGLMSSQEQIASPVQGWGDTLSSNLLVYAPLPILLGLVVSIAPNTRLFRSFILDEIDQDYVRTARAKGMNEIRVMFIHVLRNALIPVITFVVSNLPGLLLGAFLLERFFGIPGVGREIILAVERSDFPVIKAVTVYVALATMIFNLIGDLLYRLADPRIQLK
ncbi:MAG: ABC transporter permease [Betaproteobacteria bacterium]|nr:ABC transporter permease [Betaproteobacteria bacterium]